LDGVLLLALLAAAWLVYRPEAPHPLDYVDFPDNILTLKAHAGFMDRLRALMIVYGEHGRWSPVVLSLLAAQWSWFEWWTPGWQLVRFVILAGVTGLAYALFRRLGLTRVGAFAGAALLVVSPPAVMGWTRLSTAEPVGILFLLLAAHLALKTPSPATSWGIAALLLLLMWTKEIMVVAFIFPTLLVVQRGFAHGVAGSKRGVAAMLGPSLVAFAAGMVPIAWTLLQAPASAFAMRYGSADVAVADVVGPFLSGILPFAPRVEESPVTLLIVVGALAVLLLSGWHRTLLEPSGPRHGGRVLLLAIGPPILGALVYSPWPLYQLVYALPFLTAGALLLGQAVSSLWVSTAPWRALGTACVLTILSYALAQAANDTARTRALQAAVASAVSRVAGVPDVDTVLVAVAPEQFEARGNFGPRFWLYARARGLDWPFVRDLPCDQADRASGTAILVLRVSEMCGGLRSWTDSIVVPHARFAWPDPRPHVNSVRVDILLRPEGRTP
jgi:hypothetical protein